MKVIIVIDIPSEYPIEELKANVLITHKGSWLYQRHRQKLKELPQKQADIMDTDGDYGFDGGWNEGYNACIDEILGEDK